MKTHQTPASGEGIFGGQYFRCLPKLAAGMMALVLSVVLVPGLRAQTVTLTPSAPQNYWAGAGTMNNNFSANSIGVVETDGGAVTNIVLSLAGTGATVFGTLTPGTFTDNGTSVLAIAVTNAVTGFYPLTVNASGDAAASTGFNLFVVPQWAQTNADSIGNWSDNSMWSGGAAPSADDGVYIDHSTAGPWTNVVDSSRTIQSLTYLGTGDEGGSVSLAVNTTIAPGQTLSVLGTNGFSIGNYVSDNHRPVYAFNGDTLLVSNTLANFSIIASHPANDSKYIRADMSGLNNLEVHVSRMPISDINAVQDGPSLSSLVDFVMAKTNLIQATFTDDYNKASFDTAISYMREGVNNINNGQSSNAKFRLGTSNAFYADSLGIGLGNANGSSGSSFGTYGYYMAFANANSTAPTSSAVFRNANGVSRMSLLAVSVETGLDTQKVNNRGILDLRGGVTDMLVDQIWLGQNRTNSANENTKDGLGGLYFDWGKIDCNTLIAGNMKYTNNVGGNGLRGDVWVGTNGTLVVNGNLILGNTPDDVTGFEAQAALVTGQVRIDNGGTVRANKISVGAHGGASAITVNAGGTLEVSNTVASSTGRLSTLTVNSGAALTLHINGANTLIYVTNLVASSGIINIGSVAGAGSFAPVISYAPGFGEAASFVAGSVPAGYNATIFNNTSTHTIDVTLTAGTPKSLVWQGYVDNNWDTTTKNWLDASTGLHTNFAVGDSVAFDDTAAFSSINVAEDVVPRQSAGIDGMTMTNNLLAYTFSGGGGIRGAASFVKAGTNSLEIDNYTEVSLQVQAGLLTGGGTVGSVVVSSGAACSLLGGGTVLGGLINGGSLTNAGTISGSLTLQTGSTAINSGAVNGNLAMQTGTWVYNSGMFGGIGTATVTTNAMLINAGTIYGTTLIVNGTLTDLVPNFSGVSPGSINVGTLTINGTFNPGGDMIGTTKVTDYNVGGDQMGAPNGRVQLNAGSITTFQFNSTNSQPYTKLLSQSQVFGPSQAFKGINGCTLVLTNEGPTPFAAGQTFKLFGSYYVDGNIGNAGLNSTNSYPIIQPASPGPGLLWDLTQLYASGTIGVIDASSVQITLTNSTVVFGTNIITHLTWPEDFIGSGWVQQQITSLTNGLGTNWSNVGASDYVNDILLTNTINADEAVFYRFVRP